MARSHNGTLWAPVRGYRDFIYLPRNRPNGGWSNSIHGSRRISHRPERISQRTMISGMRSDTTTGSYWPVALFACLEIVPESDRYGQPGDVVPTEVEKSTTRESSPEGKVDVELDSGLLHGRKCAAGRPARTRAARTARTLRAAVSSKALRYTMARTAGRHTIEPPCTP